MGHRRREDRRDDRRMDRSPGPQGGSGPTHYQMRQGMFTIGDDFWIRAWIGNNPPSPPIR